MKKHVIVTGASRGIGYETAKYLADAGCTITVIARSEEKLNMLKSHNPDRILPLPLDITSDDASNRINEHLKQNSLKIDGLIHNAGLLINKPFSELSDSDWKSQMEVNIMAPVRLTRDLLPFFNDHSHILNISTMGGFQGSAKFPGLSAYSTTKGALSVLTECLAVELAGQNISCNCLCLGAVQTEMLQEAFPGMNAPVEPEQMGEFVGNFLLSANKFFNGKILPVALNNPS
jgi:3-oxoacyl-[acyl-carrier protein] reductase